MNISATSKTDYNLIKIWFENWGRLVSSLDFSSAAQMFEKDVVAFGTWMDTVEGVENLIESQWKSIWPTIQRPSFFNRNSSNSHLSRPAIRCRNTGLELNRFRKKMALVTNAPDEQLSASGVKVLISPGEVHIHSYHFYAV